MESRHQDDQSHRAFTWEKNPHGESSQKNHASQETFKTVTFLMTFFQQQHVHA